MKDRFTLGVEEEFQMVDQYTGKLRSCIHPIFEKGYAIFGDNIKQELLQSTVEVVTNICRNIHEAREELRNNRYKLAQLVGEEGLALISAGTHPSDSWQEQEITENERYRKMEKELRVVARSALIFGLHVHVGVESREIAFKLMNQLYTWLPELLALSTNSPFSVGQSTGYKSIRHVIWKPLPHNGIPKAFSSLEEHDHYIKNLINNRCISDAKKIWWDIRIHPVFETIEFRIYDMPTTVDDTIALAALCQALVAKLTRLNEQGQSTEVLPRSDIEENKFRATRDGLDAEVIVDFEHNRHLSMRQSISKLLDFVDDVLADLGSRSEIDYLRKVLREGTGADHQLAVFNETNSVEAVTQFLMEQTMKGILPDPVQF